MAILSDENLFMPLLYYLIVKVYVCLGHLVPELIWKLCFKMAKEAILDLEVKMVPKLYNFHSSVLSMSEIVENYISFVRLGHMVPEL